MKFLVTGGRGQLGREFAEYVAMNGNSVVALDSATLDVTVREVVHETVAEMRPDVVVNCAAMTAVDACETRVDEALAVNGHAVRWLAEACDATGARLVQISTDYVFDGTKSTPYVESDEPNPQSVYGRSKLIGEREALELGDAALVVRTSWVCGRYGSNMVKTVQRLLADEGSLAFVNDQIGHPTFAADFASMLHTLCVDRCEGLFHVTNAGVVSWYEFVCEVVAGSGADPAIVRSIRTSELDPPRPAPRPFNSVLENAALARAGYPAMRDFREPLGELLVILSRRRGKLDG